LGKARDASFWEGLQPASQLKLIIMPPPARAVTFKKDLLLMVVFTSVMFLACLTVNKWVLPFIGQP
jgi:hypothetical protein